MQRPHHIPAEKIGSLLFWLCQAVVAKMAGGQLSSPIIALIIGRIRSIKQAIARLAEQLHNGKYTPRHRSEKPRAVTPRKPAEKTPLRLQKFGWLLALVPEAAGSRSQLQFLLADPQFSDFIAAAPKPMIRHLRSLCWMLRLEPPPVLARPKRPAKPRPAPAPRATKTPVPEAPDRPGFGKLSNPKWPKLPGPRYPKGCA
jgi:hypothetical protein